MISRASRAPASRWARPPRPPPPAKSGAARPLTRSPPKPAARRACPLPLLGASENARARAQRGPSCFHSPGLAGSRAAEYLVDPSAGGKLGGRAGWAREGREERGQGAPLSYRGHQSRARVPSCGQVSRSALAGPTSSCETRDGEQERLERFAPGQGLMPLAVGVPSYSAPGPGAQLVCRKLAALNDPPTFVFLLAALPPISPFCPSPLVSIHAINWWHPRASIRSLAPASKPRPASQACLRSHPSRSSCQEPDVV